MLNEDAETLRTAKDSLTEDRLGGGSSLTSDEQSLTSDQQSLAAAEQALAADQASETNPGTTFTALPAVGKVIRRG